MPISSDASQLTRSAEDCLKAVYHLAAPSRPVSTGDLATRLEVSAAAVSGMVKRLSDQGLLEHAPYKGVDLTSAGRRVALRMVRRHRLIETYLVGFLGYTWDDVHDEADRLEHAVSDTLIERMALALGHPTVDPHGDPIPTSDGAVQELAHTPLSDFQTEATAEIRRVTEHEPERLRYLASLGLRPDVTVRVVDTQPFGGPITVLGNGVRVAVGRELARVLLCRRVMEAL